MSTRTPGSFSAKSAWSLLYSTHGRPAMLAGASDRTLLLPVDRGLGRGSCHTDNCLAQLLGLIGTQLESRVIAECHLDRLEPGHVVKRAAGRLMDAPAVFGPRLADGPRSDLW